MAHWHCFVPIDWPEPFGLVKAVIAFNRGSVPEVIEDGLTGYIVEDETSAIGAVCGLQRLSRSGIRMRFEERFTARRVAEQYLGTYRQLIEKASPRAKIVSP